MRAAFSAEEATRYGIYAGIRSTYDGPLSLAARCFLGIGDDPLPGDFCFLTRVSQDRLHLFGRR